MAEVDKRITDLEDEIKGYVTKLNAATITENEFDRFMSLINSALEILKRLIDEKAQLGGK